MPLAGMTTFAIGGPVRWLARPADAAEAAEVLCQARRLGVQATPLGGGSNLLIADAGVDTMAVRLSAAGEFAIMAGEEGRELCWKVGAAVPLPALVAAAARSGFVGLESLAGIPGTVGGAVVMNAGASGDGIGRLVTQVDAFAADGTLCRLTKSELQFAYRHSNLRNLLVLSCVVEFEGRAEPEVLLTRMREFRERKRLSQPLGFPSAGCVFKNPEGDAAGRLLEVAGCKGMRIGGAAVSEMHANFIVNVGGATARDVAVLAATLREMVWKNEGVELTPEIMMWGEEPAFAELRRHLVKERPHVDS